MAGGAHGMVAGLIAINSLRNPFAEQFSEIFFTNQKISDSNKKDYLETILSKIFFRIRFAGRIKEIVWQSNNLFGINNFCVQSIFGGE